jgi:hypothetical protein
MRSQLFEQMRAAFGFGHDFDAFERVDVMLQYRSGQGLWLSQNQSHRESLLMLRGLCY